MSTRGKKFNKSKFSLFNKNFVEKHFASGMHWQNWHKFSPGENFRIYGIQMHYAMNVIILYSCMWMYIIMSKIIMYTYVILTQVLSP